MNSSRVFRFFVASSTLLLILAACEGPGSALGPARSPLRNATAGVECASTSWMTASGIIGSEGGRLSVPGAWVDFPAGALDSPVDVSFTVGPQDDDAIAVILSARGSGSPTLNSPATVTLRFSDCGGAEQTSLGSGALGNETVTAFEFEDSTIVTPADESPPTLTDVVLSVQSFSWYIIAH